MIPQTRKYHAIIVHFGRDKTTKTLVEQLTSGEKIPDHIIVVDHAQNPFRIENQGKVRVVRPEKNAGYGAGINLGLGVLAGLGISREDIVIALNNDVQVSLQSLTRIEAWWGSHPNAKLAGIHLGQVNLITGRAEIDSTFSAKSFAFWRTRPNAQRGFRRAYLDGACLIAPLATFLALQGLPSGNFMYWEDVEFSCRASQVGIPLSVIPDTGITHRDQPASAVAGDHVYYLVRNGAMFLSQKAPRPWRYFWKAKNLVRLVYHSLRPAAETSLIVRHALRDARAGKTGPRP